MTLPTHFAFASVLYLGGATLFGYRPDAVGWALAAVACLLPDVDLPTAKIGRLFWFLSGPLERRFGHRTLIRTLTHSLVALSAVAALSGPLMAIYPPYFWAVVGGYWSHPWLDMLNLRGVDLFWPSPRGCTKTPLKGRRISGEGRESRRMTHNLATTCSIRSWPT